MTRIIMLGPPGAGKGTVSKLFCAKRALPYISTGDIFRANIAGKTELGKRVEAILSAGGLVNDELTNEIVRDRLSKSDCQSSGFVLDGYPRTINQAEALASMIAPGKIDFVFNVTISDEEIIRRLSSRRVCPKCKRTYNLINLPPKAQGKCDDDGAELIQRSDDLPETIRNRLSVYEKQTKPLEEFYQKTGKLFEIGNSGAPEEALSKIFKILNDKGQ